jgi:hypothetical protein
MNTTSKLVFITAALASLTIALTMQQDVAAFNEKNNAFIINGHNHSNCPAAGSCSSNEGHIFNGDNLNGQIVHTNDNFNSNRPETSRSNSFEIPGNESPGNK